MGRANVIFIVGIISLASIMVLPLHTTACPCIPVEINDDSPRPTGLGIIWILLHPDCLNCILGALGETGALTLYTILCVFVVLDVAPGDEIFCAFAGIEIPQVYAAWTTCKIVCSR